MKFNSIAQLFTAGAIAITTLSININPTSARPAPGERGIWCETDTSSGVPETRYQNSRGQEKVWVRWASEHFSDSGYDPITRCMEVSQRMERYRLNGQLKVLKVGTMNGQKIIGTALSPDRPCIGLIYTLKPGQNARRTLNQLGALMRGQAGVSPRYESEEVQYIDMRPMLGEDDSAAPARPTNNAAPQPQNSGNGTLPDL